MLCLRFAFLLGVSLGAPIAPLAAQSINLESLDKEMSTLVDRLSPTVVRVGPQNTGVLISPKGYVITDIAVARTLERNKEAYVDVALADRKVYRGYVMASDPDTETVILRLDVKRTFPYVRPGDPSDLATGHLLMTIGNSFGTADQNEPSVTLGVLSAIVRDAQGNPRVLETSAATNPGQEGGPYFNMNGDLIGLERNLPNGEDLATLSPIDRIVANYALAKPGETLFDKPRGVTSPGSLSTVLSRAFAISAARARHGVVALEIQRDSPPDAVDGIPIRLGPVSGTILDASGLVITALAPLVAKPKAIVAHTYDGSTFPANVVARDFKAGIALLQLDVKARALAPLPTRSSGELDLGQFCVTCGAPALPKDDRDGFVTTGLLSARNQLDGYRLALQTDAGTNVKNAGGALVDLHGRLVGVILMPIASYGQNSGLGFAIPIERIEALLPRWKKGGDVQAAALGVSLENAPGGVRVAQVTPKMPADKVGIQVGDIITELDGNRIPDQPAFSEYILLQKSAGDPLRVTLLRGKESKSFDLVLERRP